MSNCSSKNEIVIASWLHNILEYSKDSEILNIVSKILPNGINRETVIRLISNWNKPKTYDELLLAEADRLSRGETSYYIPNPTGNFYANPVLLKHLVSTLQIAERKKPEDAYCRFVPLEAEGIMPIQIERYSTAKNDYQSLWTQFQKDLENLQGLEIEFFLKTLNSLLERYWWCIPSYNSSDAESLYQLSKMTAAISAALYIYHKESTSENHEAIKDSSVAKFRFIKGDISGILELNSKSQYS